MKPNPVSPSGPYVFIPIRALDGDTFKCVLLLGLDLELKATIRLHGIDCPEIETLEGKQAAMFTSNWLTLPASTYFASVHGRDDFGRILARVWRSGSEFSLNDVLLDQKLARRLRSRATPNPTPESLTPSNSQP